jgi:fibronectin-binding autotransporter adhesin
MNPILNTAARRSARSRSPVAAAFAGAAVLLIAPAARAQTTTTLGASYTTTAMESSAALSTTGGLTLNLGLGFEYLIVGGGGGGGGNIGGGGGAGGLLTNVGGTAPVAVLSGGTAAITVGGGGAGGSINNRGTSGSSSTAFTVTAAGGGGGGFYDANAGSGSGGSNGGSGGGGSPSNGTATAGGGTASAGNSGGSATRNGGNYNAGGGGGAGAAGTNATQSVVGTGGAGTSSSITGSAVTYAAGGGGGSTAAGAAGGSSGVGGAGGGGANDGTAGQISTGSGGGGGGYNGGFGAVAGGAGADGVVIVRYRSATSLTSGGDTAGGYNDGSDDWQYERFTNVNGGTLTVNAFDAANLVATQSGVLSGSGSLTYDSPGTLTLTAANTFSGVTRVATGTLNLGNALALQNSVLDLNAADSGTVAFTVAGTNTYTLAGLSGSRALDIGGNTLALGATDAASNYSGALSGTGGLTKDGTGTLTLSGNNTFSGGLVINGGSGNLSTVVAGSNTAFGTGTVTVNGSSGNTGSTLDVNGATLANDIVLSNKNSGVGNLGVLQNTNTSTAAVLNGGVTLGGENYVGGDGDITFNGVVGGGLNNTYSLFKQGAGTWTFANEANTFDGFYYQIGGVTEVTKLANAGETSSLGQVSAGQNLFVFGFNGAGGGTLRYAGTTASTSDRAFSLRGSTAAADNTIEAAGTSAAATLTLAGGLSAGRAGTYTARLAGDNAGVNEYAGVIANGSGTVGLEKTGTTTWALSGTNTYSGGTTISAGTLSVGNGGTTGTLGGGSVSVASGATLGFDRTDTGLAVANAISGAGGIEQLGSGTTSLTGSNTYTGPTTVSAGTLSLGSGSTGGSISASTAIAVASGATFAVNRSNALTLSNTISGDGGLAKRGTGTLTLSGTNTYAGGTTLSAGTLLVTTNTALGSGSVSFATAGATLDIASDISNDIAVDANGTLAAGATNVELTGNFSGAGTLTKTGTGTLTLSGAASTFTGDLVISGGTGANSIVKAGSANAFGSGTIEILGGGGNTGSTFDLNGFSLDNGLVIGLGNSGVNNTGALQNTDAANPATLNGAVSLGGEIYVGGAGDITFNGLVSGGVNPSNAYSLYKDGAGTWSFTNTGNTFDGFYYQVDGVTEVASLANLNEPSALGQPTDANRNRFVFGLGGNGGGTLRFNGSAASTSDRVFVLQGSTAAADNTIEAAGTSAAATLTLTGGISAGRAGSYTLALTGSNAGVNEYAGVIANGSGTVAIEKTGGTTWALTGANTYSGATTVSTGTLKVGNGGTTGSLGSGSVTNDARLIFDRTNSHTVANVISGSGSVVQAGSGLTTLSGANTFSGGTTISAGTLAVATIADSGTSNLGTSGALTLAGGTLEYTAATASTTTRVVGIATGNTTSTINVSDAAGQLTLTGNVWNTEATHPNVVLNKTGSGTLEIAGAGGNAGTSLVAAAGTTLLNATARAVYEIRALDAGATVRLAQANQVFNGDAISTTGNIRMTGGTLDLDGNNQEIFRLIGSTNATAGTGTITSSSPATFTVGNNLSGRPSIFDGSLTGDLSLVTRGTNTVTLGGASSYTGTTTVTGSLLRVNGSLGNTAVTVSAGTLGGSGSIAGTVAVQAGATLAPGNSIESLSGGATTFAGGATFGYEVDSSAALAEAADLLVVDGNLDLSTDPGNRSLLSFVDIAGTPAAFVEGTTVFAMINYTGQWNGGLFSLGGQTLADGGVFSVGGQQWQIDYDYAYTGSNTEPLNFRGDYLPVSGTQTFVTITAVPEPGTLALVAAAAGVAAAGRRRFKQPGKAG